MMHSTADAARASDLVHAYLAADYRWELDGDWHDLRIGLPAPGLEAHFADARRFGLLSAWNPWSVERPEPANRSADQALHNALMASGLPFRPAFSSAPNRSWREPSWVVADMEQDAFDALSRRHGQLATLWWDWRGPVRLRVDIAPQPGFDAVPFIDWIGA